MSSLLDFVVAIQTQLEQLGHLKQIDGQWVITSDRLLAWAKRTALLTCDREKLTEARQRVEQIELVEASQQWRFLRQFFTEKALQSLLTHLQEDAA